MKQDFTQAEQAEITGIIVQCRLLRILQTAAAVAGIVLWIREGIAAAVACFIGSWIIGKLKPEPRAELLQKADRALGD